MNSAGTGATFRERSAWLTLLSIVVIYVPLFTVVLADPADALRSTLLLIGGTVIQVLIFVFGFSVLALTTPQEPDDERDARIATRANRASYWILTLCTTAAVIGVIAQQVVRGFAPGGLIAEPSLALNPLLVGHFLLAGLVISELTRLGSIIRGYRRGC